MYCIAVVTTRTYCQNDTRNSPDDKYHVWIVPVMLEYQSHLVNEPCRTRDWATRINVRRSYTGTINNFCDIVRRNTTVPGTVIELN